MSRAPVEYAPSLGSRRRHWLRWGGVLLLLVAIGATSSWWIQRVRSRATLLAYQRACLIFTPTANRVVFDHGPDALSLLPKDARYQPMNSTTPTVFYFATALDEFNARAFPPGAVPSATIFLHEREASRGQSRLVALTARWTATGTSPGFPDGVLTISSQVFRPGNLTLSPKRLTFDDVVSLDTFREGLRIEAASADPADRSHFSFVVESVNNVRTYEAWLTDSDSVRVEARPGH